MQRSNEIIIQFTEACNGFKCPSAGSEIYKFFPQLCHFVGKRCVCWRRSWRRSTRLTNRRRWVSSPSKKSWRWWQPEKDGRGRWKIYWNRWKTVGLCCWYNTGYFKEFTHSRTLPVLIELKELQAKFRSLLSVSIWSFLRPSSHFTAPLYFFFWKK